LKWYQKHVKVRFSYLLWHDNFCWGDDIAGVISMDADMAGVVDAQADLWRLVRFLVFRDIDGLAQAYMPAHQHCELFNPPDRGSAWVCPQLGRLRSSKSGTVSWVVRVGLINQKYSIIHNPFA